ncbi:MAG: sigma factor-like helix-turn-helix DNA-binding protein [Bryobacteraceae bacterium]
MAAPVGGGVRGAHGPAAGGHAGGLAGLSVIPLASRAVLALHFGQELSLVEVAATLAIPLGTVKSRLAAGLTALRNQYHSKRSV